MKFSFHNRYKSKRIMNSQNNISYELKFSLLMKRLSKFKLVKKSKYSYQKFKLLILHSKRLLKQFKVKIKKNNQFILRRYRNSQFRM